MINGAKIGSWQMPVSVRQWVCLSLILGMSIMLEPVHAQSTSASAYATAGGVHIGLGNFTEYKPPHNSIHAGDSISESVIGNLRPGTDANGNECTIDSQSWSWSYTTTYSWDNTNYGPSASQATLSGGQMATLFAKFMYGGYYLVRYQGHVDYHTNCGGNQHLDTAIYSQYFSVDKPDFDFSITNIAINQGESGTFISDLTPINSFAGQISFSNQEINSLFSVGGTGNLPTPGTAPITIGVSSSAKVGYTYPVMARGTGSIGVASIFHDKMVNVTVLKRQSFITYGATFYRAGPNIAKLNQEGSGITNGQGDTVYTNSNATFVPNYTGYWSPNSSWSWNTSPSYFIGQPLVLEGTFLPGAISSVTGFGSNKAPGDTNYVTLTLQDSVLASGTSESGYTLRYHHNHEDWYTNPAKTVSHPLPLQPGGYNTPVNPSNEWKYVFSIDNPSPAPLTVAIGAKATASLTMTGTFGSNAKLTADDILEFGITNSISVGTTVTAELSSTTTFTALPYSRTDCYFAPSSQVKGGTCSTWGAGGYISEDTWSGVYATSPNHPTVGQVITVKYPGFKQP